MINSQAFGLSGLYFGPWHDWILMSKNQSNRSKIYSLLVRFFFSNGQYLYFSVNTNFASTAAFFPYLKSVLKIPDKYLGLAIRI